MTFHIKNMVCNRCVMVVQQEFEKTGLHPIKVSLGEVEVSEPAVPAEQLSKLDEHLAAVGFERIDDRKSRLIESIKTAVIRLVHQKDGAKRKFNWSKILADELNYDYNYLSNLFSSVEGITLEQFIIRQKIERAKELLIYDELNLSEIADQLGYSSVAHLSNQFKKITGMTPSALKKSRDVAAARNPLDALGKA